MKIVIAYFGGPKDGSTAIEEFESVESFKADINQQLIAVPQQTDNGQMLAIYERSDRWGETEYGPCVAYNYSRSEFSHNFVKVD